jgi:hypothetical protein
MPSRFYLASLLLQKRIEMLEVSAGQNKRRWESEGAEGGEEGKGEGSQSAIGKGVD